MQKLNSSLIFFLYLGFRSWILAIHRAAVKGGDQLYLSLHFKLLGNIHVLIGVWVSDNFFLFFIPSTCSYNTLIQNLNLND